MLLPEALTIIHNMLDNFKPEASGVDFPYETELLKTVSEKNNFHSLEVSEVLNLYIHNNLTCVIAEPVSAPLRESVVIMET